MNNEEKLVAGLRALAASETAGPPAALEASLLKQLRRKRVISWPLALEVLAAAALVLIAVYSRPTAATDEFVTVPYSMPIGPYERAELVRVNVPVTALEQWGLQVSAFDPGQRVNADVVIGEDGLARAVRLVNP
jgi:hypothetical protein